MNGVLFARRSVELAVGVDEKLFLVSTWMVRVELVQQGRWARR